MVQNIDSYVFLFDLVGVVDQYLADARDTLERLRRFQADAKGHFPVGAGSTLKTLADNVWARIKTSEAGANLLAYELAAPAKHGAKANGVDLWFGVVTTGMHEHDEIDRILVTSGCGGLDHGRSPKPDSRPPSGFSM